MHSPGQDGLGGGEGPTETESGPVLESPGAANRPDPFSAVFALEPLRKFETVFVLVAIAAGDLFVYRAPGFLGYACLLGAFLIGLAATGKRRPNGIQWLLIALTALLVARNTWQAGFFSVVWPVVLLAAFAVLQRTEQVHLFDAAVHGLFSIAAGWIPLLRHLKHATFSVGRTISGRRAAGGLRLMPIVGGIVTMGLFTAIFMAANPVFDRAVQRVLTELGNHLDFLLPGPLRVMTWGIVGIFAAGMASPVLRRFRLQVSEEQNLEAHDERSGNDSLTALGILLGANLIFAAYNALDAVYLWGEAAPPSGISFSEFAREGAGWLTFALVLSTLFVGATTSVFALRSKHADWIRRLAYVWIFQDIVLATGTFRRIQLYVDYNGLTPMRLVGVWGTLTVVAGILAMAEKIRRRRNVVWLVRRFAVVFSVGLTLCAIFPDDFVCARSNVGVVMRGNVRPLVWLYERPISAEGAAELIPLLDHPDTLVARGVSAYLHGVLVDREMQLSKDWRTTQFSDWHAIHALRAVRSRLVADDALREALGERVRPYRNSSTFD